MLAVEIAAVGWASVEPITAVKDTNCKATSNWLTPKVLFHGSV